jgi:hypothetical protein
MLRTAFLRLQQMPQPGYNYQQYPPQQHPEMAASQYQNQTGYTPQVCGRLQPFMWC